MNPALRAFCDLTKYFLVNVSSVQECLLESKATQENLVRIIELKHKLEVEYQTHHREFETFLADKRDQIVSILHKNEIRATEQIVEDRMKRFHKQEYCERKSKVDAAKADLDMASSLMMALFQRKDIIVEVIMLMKSKQETDGCLLKNKEILRKLGIA